ncbi:hypothetical protein FDX19_15495 [Citrobacter sp. wls619]|uniref:hypothetical protein n=1 Tax=Citrobacter sp. wls619 TaxID=2576432 RepID=UPI0010C9909E|nr:hypothetical protein [Citrobacter sp. wls619]TKV08240.1 hypothetical protein FDX19_15495 [Citrobacter sp. wls619]
MGTRELILDHLRAHGESTIHQIIKSNPKADYNKVATMMAKLRGYALVENVTVGRGGKPSTYKLGRLALNQGGSIFDQCRQNWSGYAIHKIFGSASRAPA